MKKVLGVAAAILVTLGLILFSVAFVASGFDLSKLGAAKTEEHTYTADKAFERIEIHAESTDVQFKPSEDGRFRVVCAEWDKVAHTVSVEGKTLTIRVDDRREWYDHLTLFSQSQTMTVYLPDDAYEALLIDSRTGDVTVPASFSFGSIEIRTSTGDVVCGASTAGPLRIETNTGDVRIDGVQAESVRLSVSTGSIVANAVSCEGSFTTEASTGKIKLTELSCESLDARGGTGSITLQDVVASDSFRIQMGTGDVRFENCDAGSISVKASTGDVRGTLRTEKVFLTKTSTGSIRVPDSITGGRCEITTSTGDIEISYTEP